MVKETQRTWGLLCNALQGLRRKLFKTNKTYYVVTLTKRCTIRRLVHTTVEQRGLRSPLWVRAFADEVDILGSIRGQIVSKRKKSSYLPPCYPSAVGSGLYFIVVFFFVESCVLPIVPFAVVPQCTQG